MYATDIAEFALMVRDCRGHYCPATEEQILSAARRVIDRQTPRGTPFNTPEVVKDYLRTKLAGLEREVFAMLCLDSQHRLIEYIELFRGTIDQSSVYPREAVKDALRVNAAAVIFAHNHPSGHPEPSAADKTMTRTLVAAMSLLDIRTLDHILVAGAATVSFAEQGLL